MVMNESECTKQITIDIQGKVLQRVRDGMAAKTWTFSKYEITESYVIVDVKKVPRKKIINYK